MSILKSHMENIKNSPKFGREVPQNFRYFHDMWEESNNIHWHYLKLSDYLLCKQVHFWEWKGNNYLGTVSISWGYPGLVMTCDKVSICSQSLARLNSGQGSTWYLAIKDSWHYKIPILKEMTYSSFGKPSYPKPEICLTLVFTAAFSTLPHNWLWPLSIVSCLNLLLRVPAQILL